MNAPSKTEVEAPYVLRSDADGIATLTLNRGDRLNPLSSAMLTALHKLGMDDVKTFGDSTGEFALTM